MSNWITNNLQWIVSIATAAGAMFIMVQIANARIEKLENKFDMHEINQRALEQMPVKIEYILLQLQEIKVDIKEIKSKVK